MSHVPPLPLTPLLPQISLLSSTTSSFILLVCLISHLLLPLNPVKELVKLQCVESPSGRGTLSSLAVLFTFELTCNSPHPASIHILDNDSLFNIFYLYRPAIFDGDESNLVHIKGGKGWDRERWWHKLAHVCRRWRILILGSASSLGLCLVCTWGTPVADMLAHSPPLPIIIDYFNLRLGVTEEAEEGIILALKQRDRVCRIRFGMGVRNMKELIMAIDEEYPVLEYLVMENTRELTRTTLILSETFQAPRLRHVLLFGFAIPMGSRLLTTAAGLDMLALGIAHPSAYFQPNSLLQWLSSMPQLEKLLIVFAAPISDPDVEGQLMHPPAMEHISLPNLRWIEFQGVSDYMEAFVHRIVTPRLENLYIQFFERLPFSVSSLLQFLSATDTFKFDSAQFEFSKNLVYVGAYLREEAETHPFSITVYSKSLDMQVSSVAQIFNSLSQIFSTVEHITLELEELYEEHNEVDRAKWRRLLRSLVQVKTLHVDDGLVQELSRSLRPNDGENPLELLPELQELTYSGSDNVGDVFTSFIDARQNAGRPVACQWSALV